MVLASRLSSRITTSASSLQICFPKRPSFADATKEFLLDNEGISDCDALVTLTGVDEMNIIISLYGSSCKVPQIITKLGRLENNTILIAAAGSIISPKELSCNNIVQYVRAMQNQTGAALTVYTIADGQAEAVEFMVHQNTLHCGEPLKQPKIKKKCAGGMYYAWGAA